MDRNDRVWHLARIRNTAPSRYPKTSHVARNLSGGRLGWTLHDWWPWTDLATVWCRAGSHCGSGSCTNQLEHCHGFRRAEPGIFFAIKGAASGFGIVTEFKVRTEPEPGTAVKYEYTFQAGSTEERASLSKKWQAYVSDPNLTRKLASTPTLLEDSMVITGTFFGTEEEYNALNMGSQWPGVNGSAIVFQDWLGLVGNWAEEAALQLGGGVPSNFYSKSTAWTPSNLMDSDGHN